MGPKHSKDSQNGGLSSRSADDDRDDPRSGDAAGGKSGLQVPKEKKKVKKIGDY